MGLYEAGCTDPGCGKCVGEGFNPSGGWDVDDDAPYYYPQPPVSGKKAKRKKTRAKAIR